MTQAFNLNNRIGFEMVFVFKEQSVQLEGSGGDVTVNGSAFIDLKYQPGIGECRIKCYKLQSSAALPFKQEFHHAEIEYDCLKQQHIYSIHLHIIHQ